MNPIDALTLLDETFNLLVVIDDAGFIIFVNKGWRTRAFEGKLTSPNFAIGQNYLEITNQSDDPYAIRATAGIRDLLHGHHTEFSLEYPIDHEGKETWHLMRAKAIHFNERVGVMIVHEDVNVKRRFESTTREIARLRATLEKENELETLKTQIMTQLAHEFRTPLTVISNANELLQRYADKLTPEKRTQQSALIKSQIQRMSRMLDDISTALRGENSLLDFLPSVQNLEALCNNVVDEMNTATGNSHALLLTVKGNMTHVSYDERLIRLILINLLTNAVKYSAVGSTIWLTLELNASTLIISVRDEGIGIPLAQQSLIFQAFFRAQNVENRHGIGLGLNIVQSAVQTHGGSITFTSLPNRGTTFQVMLPQPEPEDPS
jgi:signal transduction histidine kinase